MCCVSVVQLSVSDLVCIYIYIFHILYLYDLLQDIEHSSLCYTVRPCCFSVLCIIVCVS